MVHGFQRKRKALFVTPDLKFNGGDMSLYSLIKLLKETSPELMIPLWNHQGCKNKALDHLAEQGINNISKIYQGLIPREYCYLGSPKGNVENFKKWVKRSLWNTYKRRFFHILKKSQYDFVHLNSVTLYPMINSDFPFIVHIREVVNELSPHLISFLKEAKGVIFIDQSTKSAFRGVNLPRSIVLNNPIDMKEVKGIDCLKVYEKYELDPNRIFFSVIGSITPVKGVDRVIEAFRNYDNPKASLLIFGELVSSPYLKHCLDLAKEDSRIRFLGLSKTVQEVYAITDYVVRGDPLFGLGRSTLEGIYAGCHVLIPGNLSDVNGFEQFSKQIHCYEPMSTEGLSVLMQSCGRSKVSGRRFQSNFSEYEKEFEGFIKWIGCN